MSYPLYIALGTLPSFVWLIFYLRKDVHPESNRMILKIFFYGMLIALPVVLIETGIVQSVKDMDLPLIQTNLLNMFVGVALIEELMKFLVVREKVLKNPEFDEPIDAPLYMIIAALGFAAVENILILFSLGPVFLFKEAFSTMIFRFIGATFLHGLCSGAIGYFLAVSVCQKKNQVKTVSKGLLLATLLHGLYNFSIIGIRGMFSVIIPLIILLSLAIFLAHSFQRLKQLKF